MGLLDKLLGRGKKAAGDMTGNSSMRSEGMQQDASGAAESQTMPHEDTAQDAGEDAAHAAGEDAAQHAAQREGESST
jgi:uncharacterized protein YjbJ (UPF0337 family)